MDELSEPFALLAEAGAEGNTGALPEAGEGELVCAFPMNKIPSSTAVAPPSFFKEVAIMRIEEVRAVQ